MLTLDTRPHRIQALEQEALEQAELFLSTARNTKTGLEETALVNTANIPANYDIIGTKHKKKVSTFALRATASQILTDANIQTSRGNPHRTRTCGHHLAYNAENITIDLNHDPINSEASISGTQTCGSIWACPVCYQAKAIENAENILKAIQWAEQNNHFAIMVALTASHTRASSLEQSKTIFKNAWKDFNKSYAWKKFKTDNGVSHFIHNVDITYSQANGWHYHKHLLLLVDRSKAQEGEAHIAADRVITKYWLHHLENNGGNADEEHGVFVSDEHQKPTDYIAKTGIVIEDDGKLHFEMTSTNTKDSRNIWTLLKHARNGDQNARRLYLEYVQTMTGDNWIQYGRTGLQEIIEQTELPADQTSTAQRKTSWVIISAYWQYIINKAYAHARVIDIAARTRDIDALRKYLHIIRDEMIEADRLNEWHKSHVPKRGSEMDIRLSEDWQQ